MSIFEKRINYKPFEYPEVMNFVDVINKTYWVHSEVDFISDKQDFASSISSVEKSAIKNALLAISQIEVAVKSFWGKVYDYLPKPEFNCLGATFSECECYSDDTEILTNLGWKFFKNLEKEDLVAQYNIESGNISFTNFTNPIKKYHDGIMHSYKSHGTDLMVTPNHEILVMHPNHAKFIKKKSIDGKWGKNYKYPCSGYAICNNPRKFGDLDRLLIVIQGYGLCPTNQGIRDFSISISGQEKIDRLKEICENLSILLTENHIENNVITFNGKLPDDCVEVSLVKNLDFLNLNNLDYNYCKEFVNELSYWDCNKDKDCIYYYNCNIIAIDKIQAICTLGGYCTNKSTKTSKDVHVVCITKYSKKIYPYKKEVEYNGFVYCVTVPEGCIVTRRNTKVSISGNCRHSEAYSRLLDVIGASKEFEKLLLVPEIRDRVEFLSSYLKKKVAIGDKRKYALALVIFSLFIENVSLFSQFAIILSFTRFKGLLKNTSNIIAWTSKDEQIHANAGIWIFNTMIKEYPELLDDEMKEAIVIAANKAIDIESQILNWIFEKGEIEAVSKADLISFMKNRIDISLKSIGFKKIFNVSKKETDKMKWFDEEVSANTLDDFFAKRPVEYSKFMQPVTSDNLF